MSITSFLSGKVGTTRSPTVNLWTPRVTRKRRSAKQSNGLDESEPYVTICTSIVRLLNVSDADGCCRRTLGTFVNKRLDRRSPFENNLCANASSHDSHAEMQPVNVYIIIDDSHLAPNRRLRSMSQRFDCVAQLAVVGIGERSLFHQTKVVRQVCQIVTFVRLYEKLVPTLFILGIPSPIWFGAVKFDNKLVDVALSAFQIRPERRCSKSMTRDLIRRRAVAGLERPVETRAQLHRSL